MAVRHIAEKTCVVASTSVVAVPPVEAVTGTVANPVPQPGVAGGSGEVKGLSGAKGECTVSGNHLDKPEPVASMDSVQGVL